MKQDLINPRDVLTIPVQMVAVPSGEIELRDDRVKQKWTIGVESFWLARFPVTQGLYYAVTSESPGSFKGDKKPVETVSWKEAASFCNALSRKAGLQPCYEVRGEEEIRFASEADGYRLPREAEWEYACKAGTKGSRYGEIDRIAWYKDNSQATTRDVGMKEPNAWGLYDMLGNVWEWCTDVYDGEVYGSYRIFRGGGWSDEARSCLATNRRRSHPTAFRIDDLGFRVARNMKTPVNT